MSERIERMAQELAALRDQVRILERDMERTAERQAQFGRPRYMIWGTLLDTLFAGFSADVQLKAWTETSPGVFEWVDRWIMEDVLAPPVMPPETCIPQTNPETDEPTWVLVAWFPLDEQYYVVGAEICPTTDCPEQGSS